MNIGDILNWVKLSPRYLFPIAIVASALMFLPAQVLLRFGLHTFAQKYQMWIGFACLAAYSLLLAHAIYWLKDRVVRRQSESRLLKALRNLSREEKLVLAEYILLQTKSQQLDIRSGVTKSLEHSNIIYLASTIGWLSDFAHNLQPWAWRELNAHPELLEPELSERRAEFEAKRTKGRRQY